MRLLKDEMEMNMRLIGATCVADLTPDLVDAASLSRHANGVPRDALVMSAYEELASPPQQPPPKARL